MLDLHRRAEMKTLFIVTVPEEDPLWIPSVLLGAHGELLIPRERSQANTPQGSN